MLKFNTHLFSVCAPILQDISGLLNEKFVEHLCGMGSIFTMIIDKWNAYKSTGNSAQHSQLFEPRGTEVSSFSELAEIEMFS